jgi:hypothetical protein
MAEKILALGLACRKLEALNWEPNQGNAPAPGAAWCHFPKGFESLDRSALGRAPFVPLNLFTKRALDRHCPTA